MKIRGQTALVTGGTQGLGVGIVEALKAEGAQVAVVARGAEGLEAIGRRLGVETIQADIADRDAALDTLVRVRPDILILNAGERPPMARLDQITWDAFTRVWDTDVKAGLFWIQAALATPLNPGSRVLVGSSGAAVSGSQMSGGYAGAKKMLWFMAKYANGAAEDLGIDIRFQVVMPRMMILGTGVGDQAAGAYAGSMGIAPEVFVQRFGAPMSPRQYGDHLVSILGEARYEKGLVFGLNGDAGVIVMDDETD